MSLVGICLSQVGEDITRDMCFLGREMSIRGDEQGETYVFAG